MIVASTNFDRSNPTRNSAKAVAAPIARGQIASTETNGTNAVTLRIRAERTTSSRWRMTVSELIVRAVRIKPKVLTWAPDAHWATTALLTPTQCPNSLIKAVKSGGQAV